MVVCHTKVIQMFKLLNGELTMNYKAMISFLLFYAVSAFALCTRPNHQHVFPEVTRCSYTQEDIRRALLDQDAKRNHETPRYAPDSGSCFYCGCPIGDHTPEPIKN